MVQYGGAAKAVIIISGRVQGVFFRASGLAKAHQLNLKYSAENKMDGTVSLAVEGAHDAIEQFIAWAHQGPPLAKVTKVEVTWINSKL